MRKLVRASRELYASLPEDAWISNANDYRPPCQMELFWLREPEYQILVSTRFEDRPDMDIRVHGPFESHDFIDEVERILREPRWQLLTPNDEASSYSWPFSEGEPIKPRYAVFDTRTAKWKDGVVEIEQ